MSPETIAQLNAINRQFYAITAPEFSATRGRAWQGWLDALPYIPEHPLRVLDVGCGNGRWALHLAEHNRLASYHGIDNNETLLQHAQQALRDEAIMHQLTHYDAIINAGATLGDVTEGARYDVVGLFGVIHHVPDAHHRQAFMHALADYVAEGGLLIFASWRFMDFERFRSRVIPWDAYDAEHKTTLAENTEEHDYLLDWRRGEHALRYCHYVDDDEQDRLIEATMMTEQARFRADGQDNLANCYSILVK